MQRPITLVVVLALLSGCAMTRSESNIEYKPKSLESLSASNSLRGAAIGQVIVVDARRDPITRGPVTDGRVILNKRNGYGARTEGVYAAEKPLGQYVRDSFDESLAKVGVTKDKLSPLEIEVVLDGVDDPSFERGFFQAPALFLTISARVSVKDTSTGKQVWRQPILARSELTLKGLFFDADDVVRGLPGVIHDLVSRCIASPGFASALRAAESKT